MQLGNDTIVIIRAPLVAGRTGALQRDWENADEFTVHNCNVQPFPIAEKLNFEDNKDREFVRTAFRFYCPAGTDILDTDRVRWNNITVEVFGLAGPWTRLSGALHHVSFIGREQRG